MTIRSTKFIIFFSLIGLGLTLSVYSFFSQSTQYYVTVDELRSREGELSGKELKVAGKVENGSIQRLENGMLWDFRIANAGKVLAITYRGAVPDTFKEGAEVVVTGKVDELGHLTASHLLAKCASRYEEKLTPTFEPKKGKKT